MPGEKPLGEAEVLFRGNNFFPAAGEIFLGNPS
jgi:hypothetical protein